MKPRRKKGATLGLIAVCVLVIIVIGVGCFFLAKICGGGREVTNATDAGTLNVAQQALTSKYSRVGIPATSPDFMALADPTWPNAGYATLYVYNRMVAQALLVAINAQQEGTGPAVTDAGLEFTELQQVGQVIAAQLEAQINLQPAFNTVAGSNSLKMYGNNAINEQSNGYQWAFMKVGGSTNVWFDPSVFPQGANPASYNLVNTAVVPDFPPSRAGDIGAYQNKYMAGYQPMTVAGVAGAGPFIGVPVFPQQTPHLVRLADFNSTNPANNFANPGLNNPPNAFSCQSTTTDAKSGATGGAIAAAIVGVAYTAGVNNPVTSPTDFTAAIPGGYIEITNAVAGNYPAGWTGPTDMSNSIFNHELDPEGGEPGIQSVPEGGTGPNAGQDVFTIDSGSGKQALADWEAYNAAGDPPVAPWTDSNGNPQTGPPSDSLSGVYVSQSGGGDAPATPQDMKGIGTGPGINCLQNLIANDWLTSPLCIGNAFQAFSNAYGRINPGGGGGGTPPSNNMWSAVDGLKADIMQQYQNVGWNGGNNHIDITYTGGGSGDPGPTPASPWQPNAGPGSQVTVDGAGGASGPGTFSTSAYSGLGVYKIGQTDPEIANDIATGPRSDANLANDPWWAADAGATTSLNQQPLEQTSPSPNVWALLGQVGTPCAMSTTVNDMVQRIDEIVPGTTLAQVQMLLQSPAATLNMGNKLYISKVNPNDPTPSGGIHGLQILNTPPPNAISTTKADGSQTAGVCSATYPLNQGGISGVGLVDSFGNFTNGGDNNIHEQPFLKQVATQGEFTATDHADFILSSGYQNLLGQLSFYQQVQGGVNFSRPN